MPNAITLPAALTSLSPLATWLAEKMAPLHVNDEWRFALDLATCEGATNIIRHALHEDEHRLFSVEFTASRQEVTVRFTDAGDEFPLQRLAEARNEPLSDVSPLSENGRGLKLILLCVDELKVERHLGENVTTFKKFFSP